MEQAGITATRRLIPIFAAADVGRIQPVGRGESDGRLFRRGHEPMRKARRRQGKGDQQKHKPEGPYATQHLHAPGIA